MGRSKGQPSLFFIILFNRSSSAEGLYIFSNLSSRPARRLLLDPAALLAAFETPLSADNLCSFNCLALSAEDGLLPRPRILVDCLSLLGSVSSLPPFTDSVAEL